MRGCARVCKEEMSQSVWKEDVRRSAWSCLPTLAWICRSVASSYNACSSRSSASPCANHAHSPPARGVSMRESHTLANHTRTTHRHRHRHRHHHTHTHNAWSCGSNASACVDTARTTHTLRPER
eukprot:995728-Rhodomonas_salina.1